MKIIKEITRILLGLTFIFSGFVKGIDPLGSTYKFTDYFNAMGNEWATRFAFILAVILALAEFGIGIALLFNYRLKIVSWLALLFMAFFLPVTLWVAVKNPVSDCGCFGDALVISNWQTFFKNIVLTIFAIIVVMQRSRFVNRFNIKYQNVGIILILLIFGFLQQHSYRHLPLIDFRPFKIGANIPDGMVMPADAPTDQYRTEFIYQDKQTGETKEFNETNYPWQDTLKWEYVDSKSILVKAGYHPPIHDFTMENSFGEDVSEFYLFDENYTFILVAYNLDKTITSNQNSINSLAQEVLDHGMNFICLTSSGEEEIEQFKHSNNTPYEFLVCDEITLKTIIRSNPGLLLTSAGTILGKWHWRDIPSFEKLELDTK
ncbi:MAG: BT_3928 family protein [Prolixibacteraceae bacterium]